MIDLGVKVNMKLLYTCLLRVNPPKQIWKLMMM